jgi:hypothetical protein
VGNFFLWALDIFRAGGRVVQEVKMTSTVTKAADLLTDSTFLALCASWQRDRRAPLCLPDFLREWGLDRQAETAEWAVKEPDRPDYIGVNGEGGIKPTFRNINSSYCWYYTDYARKVDQGYRVETDDLESVRHRLNKEGWCYYETFAEAVVDLLDNYEPPQE